MKLKYQLAIHSILLCACFSVTMYVTKQDGLKTPAISLVDPCSKFCICDSLDNSAACVVPYNVLHLQKFGYWTLKNLTLFGYFDTPEILPLSPWLQSSLCGVKHLTFEYLLSGILPNNSFVCSTDMVSLILADNNVTALSARSFTGLINLRFLNLSGNAIKEITPDVFRELYSISVIDLSRNELKFLPDGLFSKLKSLEKIDLSKNKLKKLSEIDFLDLISLHELNLQYNDVHHLSTAAVDWLISVDLDRVVKIEGNPLECTCTMAELLTLAQSNESRSSHYSEMTCGGHNNFTGILYKEVDISGLPCDPPEISYISDAQNVLVSDHLQLTCQSIADPAPSIYWITPWGDKFAHSSMLHLLPSDLNVFTNKRYSGILNPVVSNIHTSTDGTLHIDAFRGAFMGNFTCVAYSYVGNSTAYVDVKVYSIFKDVYILSQCIGAAHAGFFLLIGLLTGFIRISIRFCKKHCVCCQKMEKKETGHIEDEVNKDEIYPEVDGDSFGDDNSGTKPPFNSPLQRTPGSSPKKCLTPNSSLERETTLPANIWDTLEEARTRLVDGVGRKVDKVRSHVKSITETSTLKIQHIKETGSLKIQSIRETGSNAAYRVKAGVVLGMEQVKFGVQSIKEFCGTGEMGTQTMSMVSVSTDVDTQERCQIVKLHTVTTV
ncbi:hypothetical protein ACJMK2_007975 [Sinanodonta woodiana]|uniref:Ig-like domain-containing protein n=1 Tax=Sinanodonta woodiana TaxID=1069815 RepID=A0ABD3VK51_SINWO